MKNLREKFWNCIANKIRNIFSANSCNDSDNKHDRSSANVTWIAPANCAKVEVKWSGSGGSGGSGRLTPLIKNEHMQAAEEGRDGSFGYGYGSGDGTGSFFVGEDGSGMGSGNEDSSATG